MQIEVIKSKIHRVTVTQAELDYIGSVTIDEDLMDAAQIYEHQKVDVLCYNGERLTTYVIKGERGSGVICINGPASLKIKANEQIIIIAYATIDEKEVLNHKPIVIFPDVTTNKLR